MSEIHELYFSYVDSKKQDIRLILFIEKQENQHEINAIDEHKRTVLHYAANDDDLDIIKLLLAKSAKTDLVDIDGNRPIHYSLYGKDINKAIYEEFIKNGSSRDEVNKIDLSGRNFLRQAVMSGSVQKVESLLAIGADVNLLDKWGTTPISIAISRKDEDAPIKTKLIFQYSTMVILKTPVIADDTTKIDLPLGLTEGVIVIGSTHNEKPVDRTMPAYVNAITNVKEFDAAVEYGAKFNYRQLAIYTKKLINENRGNEELSRFYERLKVYISVERTHDLKSTIIYSLAKSWVFSQDPKKKSTIENDIKKLPSELQSLLELEIQTINAESFTKAVK